MKEGCSKEISECEVYIYEEDEVEMWVGKRKGV
jgi:hypothetical protein